MSRKILQDINNLVDNQSSEYYYYNKRKRHFWHSKSVTVSCRMRDKNEFNRAKDIAINIRAFLLNKDKKFLDKVWSVANELRKKDMDILKNYIYSLCPNSSKEELDKKMGLIIMSLPEEDIRAGLNLQYVVSCRLLGYEKEFFYLKCYWIGIWPSFILRCLYHTEYLHSEFESFFDQYSEDRDLTKNSYIGIDLVEEGLNNPYAGLDFSYYLAKIKFI